MTVTEPNGASNTYDTAVIGCGVMGAALARALAASGCSVAVWNRTPGRAEALASNNISPVRSVGDAVRSSGLVVACMSTYEVTRAVLDPVAGWRGTVLVNLANGGPDEAKELERWAVQRHAEYLDGAILCFPRDIGSTEATIVFSGSLAAWSRHERTLLRLAGASRYISDQVAAASVLDVGMVGGFFTAALSAYVEAATLRTWSRRDSRGVAREYSDGRRHPSAHDSGNSRSDREWRPQDGSGDCEDLCRIGTLRPCRHARNRPASPDLGRGGRESGGSRGRRFGKSRVFGANSGGGQEPGRSRGLRVDEC
ncbi:MAG: FAD-dependent oxidoreductase [Pseudonocardiaceae bacterium]